jgi:hypothetical protein
MSAPDPFGADLYIRLGRIEGTLGGIQDRLEAIEVASLRARTEIREDLAALRQETEEQARRINEQMVTLTVKTATNIGSLQVSLSEAQKVGRAVRAVGSIFEERRWRGLVLIGGVITAVTVITNFLLRLL